MHVFERGMHHSSVRIAKERLKSLLFRIGCSVSQILMNFCAENYTTQSENT